MTTTFAESVIGLYKTELIRQKGPWRDLDQVEYATLEYVDWFNHACLYVGGWQCRWGWLCSTMFPPLAEWWLCGECLPTGCRPGVVA